MVVEKIVYNVWKYRWIGNVDDAGQPEPWPPYSEAKSAVLYRPMMCMHAYTHTHTCTHTQTHIHTHNIHIHACIHTHAHTHRHTYTHTTYAYMHAYTVPHMHTHTDTQYCSESWCCWAHY